MSDEKWQALSNEVHDIWNQNAAFWDDFMGEGNQFQRLLIAPAEECLLDLQGQGHGQQQILDIACGNGNFARRLAALGAQVVACDFSETFIARAKAHTLENADRIDYRVVDATQREQLLALGLACFDAAICNMALMDIPNIEPLLESLPRLLKPRGRFIFSVPHPCFNSVSVTKSIEKEDHEGELITQYAVKVSGYMTPFARKGLGVIGQPAPHYLFHRLLSMLLNTCFDAGFVLDRIEEPCFGGDAQPDRLFSWANYKDIPPVLVARLLLVLR
jgi:2-polyprenyl-3-methyl-5-hydroxy-6-metoxy-1,4-benzoquinol methylase